MFGFSDFGDQFATIGGPVLVALLILSIVATATAILKIWQFATLGVGSHASARKALDKWAAGERREALDLVDGETAPLSRVTAEAMRSVGWMPDQMDWARDNALRVGGEILAQLSRRLRILEIVVQSAPMLGLLGTVLGMISAFGELAASGGANDPAQLAGGIWVALTTTALGLIIAIPFYFVASWLDERIERERSAMEAAIGEVLARSPQRYGSLTRPRRERPKAMADSFED